MRFGGGSYTVALNNNRATTESLNTLFNPAYNTNWSAAYTQPIMRGFKTDANRQGIQVTKINRDISDVQLRATITNTLSNVRNAYWDYVFAVQSVQVAQTSVDLAVQLVRDNQTRVQVGTMAPLDVVTAQAQAATAQQNLVTAQGTKRTAEPRSSGWSSTAQDPLWNATIDPVDRGDFSAVTVDLRRPSARPRRAHRPRDRPQEPRSQRRHAPDLKTSPPTGRIWSARMGWPASADTAHHQWQRRQLKYRSDGPWRVQITR